MAASLIIGFIGAGKMATALAKGFLQAKLAKPNQILASDPVEAARTTFSNETGARSYSSNIDLVRVAQVVFLAVKPDQANAVLTEIRPELKRRHLLVSVVAGLSSARIEAVVGEQVRVIRVMPNTPVLVRASATAYAPGTAATPQDCALVEKLFSAIGVVFKLKESLLDAVTGLSGSGPAYVYQFIEALSDGGVACGLPREVATKLAAQTVLGAAKMVLETGLHPGALKDMVTSPGGTTIEGIHELEKGKFRAVVMNAVRSAAEKSRRLGQD